MPPQEFNRNRGPSPLSIPGQQNIHFEHLAGPLSSPVSVNIAGPNGVHAIVYGGLTARAHLAAILMASTKWPEDEDGELRPPTMEESVKAALEMASALLVAEHKMTMDEVAAARAEAERIESEKTGVSPGGIALP